MKKEYVPPQEQEIGFKNYNPFILSLNQLQDDLIQMGMQMYNNPLVMEKYHIALENIYSKYSAYFFKKEEIKSALSKVNEFLMSGDFIRAMNKLESSQTPVRFDERLKKNIILCRKKLLEIFEIMNSQFAANGLIPTPEKKDEELWEREKIKTIRLRKKAVLDVVFGDVT